MNLSLTQILEKFKKTQKTVTNLNTLTYTKNKNNIQELYKILTDIKHTLCKVDNIYQICENEHNIMYKIRPIIKKRRVHDYQDNLVNIKIAPDLNINTIHVNSIHDIPITPMYWINDINQFGININGVILRGNIGNIFNKSHIQSGNKISQTIICKHGNACKLIMSNKLCKFYHDPCDLLKIYKSGIMTRENYNIYKLLHRNFINTSWLPDYTNKKNNMRKFSSRNTLKCDFNALNFEHDILSKNIHIQNYKHQCIHDILVILATQNNNVLKVS
jgi:hypothetical protein